MENIELLQKMKSELSRRGNGMYLFVFSRLDYEEKQHHYDEQINHLKKLEQSISEEGVHYQQLIKRYYELGEELTNAQNALQRLKQQKDNLTI